MRVSVKWYNKNPLEVRNHEKKLNDIIQEVVKFKYCYPIREIKKLSTFSLSSTKIILH
jgi:hypothetical protein